MHAVYGQFRLLSHIASGGMGETFVAERTGPAGLVQRVCVKRILPADAGDPTRKAEFLSEARVVAMLRHPNIVSLVDFGRDGNTWWMSLELVEGSDLRTVLSTLKREGKRLPLDTALFIAAELAKALSYAHTCLLPSGAPAKIVHRDVKPANVMVSSAGAVKLTDFGIAKAVDGVRTRTGDIKGSVHYMSLEHAQGLALDGRTDLFSLGVVMFEMLGGERPFDGATDMITSVNVAAGRKKDLRTLAPGTPEGVVRIIDRLLAPDVEARTQSAEDLLDELSTRAVPRNVVRDLGAYVLGIGGKNVVPSEGTLTLEEVTALTKRG